VADVRVLLAGWFSFDELIATVGDEPKVASQAAALDWPLVVPAEELTAYAPDAALERCLSCALAERGGAGNARARAWFEEQLAG
jgi:hypothetical protein